MNDTELQYFYKIGKSNKRDRWNCFTFVDYCGNLQDYNKATKVINKDDMDRTKPGYILSQLFIDDIILDICSAEENKDVATLYYVILHDIQRTYSVYNIAKALNVHTDIEHTLSKLRAIVMAKHADNYKLLNHLR